MESKMIAYAKNSTKSWNEISDDLLETCKHIDLTKFKYTDEFSSIDFLCNDDQIEAIGEWLKKLANDRVDLAGGLHHGYNLDLSASEESKELESTPQRRTLSHSELGFEDQYRTKSDLEEKYESSVGRFISTNERIVEGTLVMEENAFAFVPVYSGKEMNETFEHCQHCGEINCVPALCPKCKCASYCSNRCRDNHKYIHQHECAGYRMNLWMNVGIAHLAFRTFITGFDQSQQQFAQMKPNLTGSQVLFNLISYETNFVYRDVLKLITNFDKMNPKDLLTYCLTARMLVLYLDKYTAFFSEMSVTHLKIMPEKEDWKVYAMAMLLKHLGHMIMNAHTISGIQLISSTNRSQISPRNFHLVTEVNSLFSAIFPKTSILNHSCNENARNFFDGRTLRMFAQCDIQKNAELTNSYGPNYRTDPTDARQSLLMERYHFQCNCEKCTTIDKTFDSLSQQTCSNESCKSRKNLYHIEFQWWNFDLLEDFRLISEIMPLFRCKRCHEMQKLNPTGLKKYYNQVWTAKNENIERTVRVNCLEESAYYYLESATSLAFGHELRIAMAEVILKLDMFDLVAERDEIQIPLALVAVDFCKNIIQRCGFYSLEYMKSMTYAFHLLNIMSPRKDVFKQMIEESIQIKNIHKYIHILPQRMRILYGDVLNNV